MTFKPNSNCPRYHSQEHECRKRYEKCSYRKKTKKCYKKRPTRGKPPCGGLPRYNCVSTPSCSYSLGPQRQYCANRRKTSRRTKKSTQVPSRAETINTKPVSPKLRRSSRLAGLQKRTTKRARAANKVKTKSPPLSIIAESTNPDRATIPLIPELPRMKTPLPPSSRSTGQQHRRSTRRRTANRNYFNGLFNV